MVVVRRRGHRKVPSSRIGKNRIYEANDCTVCKQPVHQERSELSQAHQSEVRMDETTRDESRHQDQGRQRPPQADDAHDPPPPTHSVRLAPHQVENLASFLEWNQLLRGHGTTAYEVAIRRDRRGGARLELTLLDAATTPQMEDHGEGTARSRDEPEGYGIGAPTNTVDSAEAVTGEDSDSNEVGETDGERGEEIEEVKEEGGEGEGEEGAEPPQISNKTEEKVKFTAVHEGKFRHYGAQKENGREPLRAAAESNAPSTDPGAQLRNGKEKVQKAQRGKTVVLRLSMLRQSPDSRQDQEEEEETTSSGSSSSAPWPEELEDVHELFDLESIEEFDEETGSSDSSDSFFLSQRARERIALAWARRNLLNSPEEEEDDDVAEAPRAEDPAELVAEEAMDEAAELLHLQDEVVPEAEESGNEAKEEEKDGEEVEEDEEANDQAGPAAQPVAAPQQAAAGAAGPGQTRQQRAGQRPRSVAQRASRRLRGLGVGQAVRRVPPALAGHSAAQLLVKIREELEAKVADGGYGDEELRRVGRLSSAMTSLQAIEKGRVVTDVQFGRILRKIEKGF
ncbi:unnamed protein product [Caenorhabditis auriculariae]|uniref:Uncharacterized protein n=1 Tax=Caenorhabditis auriculariae TaxID=2777116 RepID=A0A8S1HP59_9PELO|nr:unnamed protein product [Caenorhabditis auriculariae]